MAENTSVPFELRGGSPTVVEVTARDGKKYHLRLVVNVVDVVQDLKGVNAENPAMPTFQVGIQLNVHTAGPV